MDDVIRGHPMYIHVAVHYIRPKQATHVREVLQPIVREVVSADDLDLEVDPVLVSLSLILSWFGKPTKSLKL